MNFDFITHRLATGAELDSANVNDIVNANITHIIDCRIEYDDAKILSQHPNISLLWNGVLDDGLPKSVNWFRKSIEFALDALSKPKNKVLAHCSQGINRGPSTAFAIMLALGWEFDKARREIMLARPIAKIAYANCALHSVVALGYV